MSIMTADVIDIDPGAMTSKDRSMENFHIYAS